MGQASLAATDTEGVVTVADRMYVRDGTKRAVIWCHASTNDQYSVIKNNEGQYTVAKAITEAGFPIVCPLMGSTTNWGNDTAQTKIGAARTYIASALNAKTSKVILAAVSMGAIGALNWARANPTLVEAIVLMYPAVNLVAHHDATGGSADFSAAINAAYTDAAGYAAAVASHDPAQHATDYAGVPIKMYYSTNDGAVGTANQTAFASAVGGSAFSSVSLGATVHPQLGSVPTSDLTSFLLEHA